ncbi:F-box protein At5g07670-like [Cynara cardunculus var. scolymus]|uniref:F-box protein At5g07670-like n=1 Tax=Cynara cardunculus var. scolymus TaxID=59895 RepID=UPI000D62B437|nr:F-box protein At5g07670-like [Cynara cardunculus var. scolymus]
MACDFPQIVVSNDLTSIFSDEILLHILSKLSEKSQRNSNYLGSKWWLNLQGRLGIDRDPDIDEHLGFCPMLERLHLERCQLRIKQSVRVLFYICQDVHEVVFKNCWGFNDGMFFHANLCRRLKFVYLEGCSRLTTQGLEAVVLSWKELESLKVISCKNIKGDKFTLVLFALFSALKEF